MRASTTAPNGFSGVRSGRGNSESRRAMLSGPMNIRWKVARGKRKESCCHTSRGREDSARAPRMKMRTGGECTRRPLIVSSSPRRGGWSV